MKLADYVINRLTDEDMTINSYLQSYGVIYLITNLLNGKRYFGQTTHKSPLSYWRDMYLRRAYKGGDRLVHRAIRKYGSDYFSFAVVLNAVDKLHLDIFEDLFIQSFQTLHPNGYNLKSGGAHGLYSADAKMRMSRSAKISGAKPEVKEKHKQAMLRPGASERLSAAIRAGKASAEARAKARVSQKKAWADPALRALRIAAMNRPEIKALESRLQKEIQNRPGARERRRMLCSLSANLPAALAHNSIWHSTHRLITNGSDTRWIGKDVSLPPGRRELPRVSYL